MQLLNRFRKKVGSRKGFTLIEVLIVLVVLAIIAGAAIPIIVGQTNKGYKKEAIDNLAAVRDQMMVYYQTHASTYVGASLNSGDAGYIQYDPNNPGAGQTVHFAYVLSNLAAGTFTCTATGVDPAPHGANDKITIDQTGTVTPDPAGAFV